jgi:hypothetical protein
MWRKQGPVPSTLGPEVGIHQGWHVHVVAMDTGCLAHWYLVLYVGTVGKRFLLIKKTAHQKHVPACQLGGIYHCKRLPLYGRLKSLVGQTWQGCASYLT